MKWSDKQVSKLRELCFAEVSNAEIADKFGVPVSEIHAKRSRLGITIPKVKAIKAGRIPAAATINPEFEKAAQEMDKAYDKETGTEPKGDKLLFFWVLEQLLKIADAEIEHVASTSEGKTVTITYRDGYAKIVNVECDSLLAIIADVTSKCK